MVPKDVKIRNGRVHPILPLGWQISDYALEVMQSTVKRKQSSIDTIKQMFDASFKKQ
jgi:hypothetical protein